MAFEVELKQGDKGVSFQVSLVLPDGTDVSFVSGDVATLKVRRLGESTNMIEAAMDKDLDASTCSYEFTDTDTATPGEFESEVNVVFANGRDITWPKRGKYNFLIDPSL